MDRGSLGGVLRALSAGGAVPSLPCGLRTRPLVLRKQRDVAAPALHQAEQTGASVYRYLRGPARARVWKPQGGTANGDAWGLTPGAPSFHPHTAALGEGSGDHICPAASAPAGVGLSRGPWLTKPPPGFDHLKPLISQGLKRQTAALAGLTESQQRLGGPSGENCKGSACLGAH